MNGTELARRLLEDEEVNPRDYLHKLTRQDIATDGELIYARYNEEDPHDPFVRCPKCGHEGTIMNDFSYLASGFNGIQPGDPDDLDVQECGNCSAKLGYHEADQQAQEEVDRREEEEFRRRNGI
jgi:hypothetical protein